MDWGFVFSAINIIAMIGWALLAFTPRGPKIHALVFYLGVGLLAGIYSVGLVTLITNVSGLTVASFGSIEGIGRLFRSDAAIVVGWTHYLAFDLFVGQWIARDADIKKISRLVQLPVLFLTLMAGPFGLFVWMIIREPAARKAARG